MPGRRRKPGVRQEGPGIRLVCQHGEADEEKIGICARMAVARISQKRIRGYCRREYRHGSKRNQKEPKFQGGSGADADGEDLPEGKGHLPLQHFSSAADAEKHRKAEKPGVGKGNPSRKAAEALPRNA